MAIAHQTTACCTHLGRQFWPLHQVRDGARELLDVSGRKQQSSLAVADQLAPGAEVGGDNRPTPCIRLKNALAQGLVGSGRQNSKLCDCDLCFEGLSRQMAEEFDVLEFK